MGRVVIRNLSWETYEALLRERVVASPRLAFDRGSLELMSPSSVHETVKSVVARFVEAFTEEMVIDVKSSGSTSFRLKSKQRGLEPDESYHIQNEARVGHMEINLEVDPPPDLAIEVDLQRSEIHKLGVYSALKFPEVWSVDGSRIMVHVLQPSGTYAESEASAALPGLPIPELTQFQERIGTDGEMQILRAYRRWVREKIASH